MVGPSDFEVTFNGRDWMPVPSSFKFTVYSLPVVTSVSPRSGPLSGGTVFRVAFAGHNTGVVQVALDAAGAGQACVVESPGVAVCTTPAAPPAVLANHTSTCLVVTVRCVSSPSPPPPHPLPHPGHPGSAHPVAELHDDDLPPLPSPPLPSPPPY